jgi:TolB protein
MRNELTMLPVLLTILLLTASCNKDNSKTDNDPDPPYTGNVIAYCYQNPNGNPYHQIYSINEDATGIKKISNATIGLNHMDWSSDATKFAMVGYVDNTNSTWSIHTMNANGSNLVRLTTTLDVWDTEPVWSPDMSQIAFTRIFKLENDRNEIWLMSADGTNQHSIGVIGFAPRWSIDGSKFVYSTNIDGNWEIYICNIDGTDQIRLTNNTVLDYFPSWSPDGTKILFTSQRDNSIDEVYLMNADGTGVQRITNNSKSESWPRFSPDGTKILFCSDIDITNHWEIYTMNADGTNVTRVTRTPGSATAISPTWKPLLE